MDSVFGWMATLGDPVRARMLRLVERQELSVGEIASVLQLPQSTTSRHLKVLNDDEWLASRRDGTSRLYRLASHSLASERAELWRLLRDKLGAATQLDDERLEHVLSLRQSKSQAFFAEAALGWDKLRVELFGEQLDERILPAFIPPGQVIADLGCGTGRLSEQLAPFAERLIAVDASEAMLGAAQVRLARFPNTELHLAELTNLPLETASVDLALVVLVLHYLPAPGDALREVRRVLRKGGRAVVIDMQPHTRQEYQQRMGHHWLGFEPERLEGWFRDAGFVACRNQPLPHAASSRGPALFSFSAQSPE